MRRNVGTEKDTAYGGERRRPGDLSSILPPPTPLTTERDPEEVPAERAAAEIEGGELVTVTVDGVEVRVPKGATIFQASERAGYTPPHFCYHRDLSIPANCRMCLCEVEGQGKLQPSCNVTVADGMTVKFDTDKVREAIQGVMEFEFKNHPLDCPVCDQVGECYLQKYYLEVGKYVPLPIERIHKDKVKDLGPITLDAERCVLCSRCVRFGEEIAGTADFVIANRSDHAEIMTFDDRPVATQYALNYTDICPVGALTSTDFRFRKRVYWLESHESVCPECSTGCNVYADESEDRLYRYRPRHNDDVNDSWMCDPGRLSHGRMADTSDRIAAPLVRGAEALEEIPWDEAVRRAAEAIRSLEGSIAAIASPRMSNEDLASLAALVETAGGPRPDFRVDDSWRHVDELVDGILIRADPNPNTRGALEILRPGGEESGVPELLGRVASGAVRGLILCDWAPDDLGEAGRQALEAAEWVLFLGPRAAPGIERAHLVLPTSVHVERDGTFTNHAGRVQRFHAAVTPFAESRPAWRALADVRAALGGEAPPATVAEAFAAVAAAAPAFADLPLEQVGDQGVWLHGWEKDGPQPPIGAYPRHGVRAPTIG